MGRVAICPLVPDELVVLLAPHHAREGLALDITKIIGHWQGADSIIKVICFLASLFDYLIENLFIEVLLVLSRESETNNYQCVSAQYSNIFPVVIKANNIPAHSPGATPPDSLNWNQAAHLVPVFAGFTASFLLSTIY